MQCKILRGVLITNVCRKFFVQTRVQIKMLKKKNAFQSSSLVRVHKKKLEIKNRTKKNHVVRLLLTPSVITYYSVVMVG